MMSKKPYNLSTNPFDPNSLIFIGNSTTNRKNDRRQLFHLLMEKHMIETLERFKWEGLPEELDQDIIERILYFRGKGAFFKYNETHFFLPFTLNNGLDPYGRYKEITPVNWIGSFDDKGKPNDTFFLPYGITGHSYVVAYSKELDIENPAFILNDRSLAISQDLVPQSEKIKVLIERLVNTLIMIETNNINGVQTYALYVPDQAQKDAVEKEFEDYDDRILSGKRVTVVVNPMAGTIPLQEMNTAKNITDSQRYWQSFSSWDNLRKSIIGIANGGQHLKMEHATDAETELSSESASLVMSNALRQRQTIADRLNSYWGTNIRVFENCDKEEEVVEETSSQTDQIEGNDE